MTVQPEAVFRLSFDGEEIKEGSIDVNDLAPSLLALADLIDETNKHTYNNSLSVALRVRSGFERGSFTINLELARSLYEKFVTLFSSSDVTALATLLSLLGISGYGLFQLIRKAKGNKPHKIVEIENTTKVKVYFENDNEPAIVEKEVSALFNNSRARHAISRLVKPLRTRGIDIIRFFHNEKETFNATENEADYFLAPDEREHEVISEAEVLLRIMAISFKEGNKWRLSDGANVYFITILDEGFLNGVHAGTIRFGENDSMRVILRTRQWYEADQLKISREVIKVLEYMPSGRQMPLPLE